MKTAFLHTCLILILPATVVGLCERPPVENDRPPNTRRSYSANGEEEPCPIFGCTPGGSFSFSMDSFPVKDIRYHWMHWQSRANPEQRSLGCVGNPNNVICTCDEMIDGGYVSLDPAHGNVVWKDDYLHAPGLPLMNLYGEIIGSDGNTIVDLYVNGTPQQPIIDMNPSIAPIFSLKIADDNIFFLASKRGRLVTYETNGIVYASLWLNETINDRNGTFVPIATPVISDHRLYVLAEFHTHEKFLPTGLIRLFAIDLQYSSTDCMHVTWFRDLQSQSPPHNHDNVNDHSPSEFGPEPALLVHDDVIFLAIPSNCQTVPGCNKSMLYVVKDMGNTTDLIKQFQSNIVNLAFSETIISNQISRVLNYEENPMDVEQSQNENILWGSAEMNKIHKMNLANGDIISTHDIGCNITSKIMIISSQVNGTMADVLVFGASVFWNDKISSILVAINASAIADEHVDLQSSSLWYTYIPNNYVVTGQIIGYSLPPTLAFNNVLFTEKTPLVVAKAVGINNEIIVAVGETP